ncbi:MASE1 domain-containing protein [Streptomyces sp. PTD9-10]|uniref:MASE1 domain-containing protein n=1 Tax=Streptomyces sp. PTD9-10 TaxID=3120151 RepID=UPI00300987B0
MAVAPHERLGRAGLAVLEICVVAGLYFGAAKVGLLQQLVRGQVTPLWPPSGIAVASLLLRGPRVWPGIALGAFLVNFPLGPSLPAVLAIVVGNTLAPLCSCWLLHRAGFRKELDSFRDALALIFLGAFTGMLVSATTGTGTLVLAGVLTPSDFWPTWSVWWTGDAMGVLVVTPVLLVLSSARWPREATSARWVEGLLLVAAVATIGYIETSRTPLLFLGFPLLVWAAFRFQLAGAAPCALAVSTFAIIAAGRQTGPFSGRDLLTNMITLQAFNGSAALTALLLAAVVSKRNTDRMEIERACRQLAGMAARIATGDHRPTLPDGEGESPARTDADTNADTDADAGTGTGTEADTGTDTDTEKAVSSSLRRRPPTGNKAGRDDRI